MNIMGYIVHILCNSVANANLLEKRMISTAQLLSAGGGSWTRRHCRRNILRGIDGVADEGWGPGSETDGGNGGRNIRARRWRTGGGCISGGDWTGRTERRWPIVRGAGGRDRSRRGVDGVADVEWEIGPLTNGGDGLGDARTRGGSGCRGDERNCHGIRRNERRWPIARGIYRGVDGVAYVDCAVGPKTDSGYGLGNARTRGEGGCGYHLFGVFPKRRIAKQTSGCSLVGLCNYKYLS